MAMIVVSAEGMVDAPADTVYRYIADMREHHPRFLPRRSRTSGVRRVEQETKRQASLRKHLPGGAHADQGTRRADHSKDDQRDICHYPQTKNRNKPAFHIG